jgi:hypothetical protein
MVEGWDAGDYETVEKNLEGMTTDILDMSIDELPKR